MILYRKLIRPLFFGSLLVLLLQGQLLAQAGEGYGVTVSFENFPAHYQDKQIFLWRHMGSMLKRIDSTLVENNTAILTQAKTPGLYKVGFYPTIAQPVMLGVERDVEITATYRHRRSSFDMEVHSRDQQAYQKFEELKENYQAEFQAIMKTYQNQVTQLDAAGQRALLERTYDSSDSLALVFNQQLDQLAETYPETYTAKYYTEMSRPVLAPDSLEGDAIKLHRKARFWKYIDFSDPNFLYNDFFYLKVYQYVNEFSGRTQSGFIEAVDTLMTRAEVNQEMYDFMANYLMEVFNARGPDGVLVALDERYMARVQDTAKITRQVLNRLHALDAGNPAPEIALPDSTGQKIALHDVMGERATLIYVWSSTCHHCREATPRVVKILKPYIDQGLSVYAVSLDKNKAPWVSSANEFQMHDWVNVSDLKQWQSEIVTIYGIRRTPYLVLIDADGNLVEKDIPVDRIAYVMAEYFAQNDSQ